MTEARQFGSGPLSRVVSFIYTLAVVEGLLLLTILPGVVPYLFLDRNLSNIPLVALCALPLGPALSAALYALGRRTSDLTDLAPARSFWRGYRLNWRSVLVPWTAGLVWLSVVGLGLANFRSAGLPLWWGPVLVLVGALALVWLCYALLVSSLFSFRGIDVLRLAWFLLGRTPLVTLGVLGVVAIAGVVTAVVGEAVTVLFASVLLTLLLRTAAPALTVVTNEFTAPAEPGDVRLGKPSPDEQ